MKQGHSKVIKLIAFISIFVLIMLGCIKVFSVLPDDETPAIIKSFYGEKENDLSVVCIGSSCCHEFWNPMIAWENYGIKSYNFSLNAMPIYATEFMMREARKTQPDAKYVVVINAAEADDMTAVDVHRVLRYMPDSDEKKKLQSYLSGLLGFDEFDQLEFKYPFIRFRAKPLTEISYILKRGFDYEPNWYNGTITRKPFLGGRDDISDSYPLTDQTTELPESLLDCFSSLLDYCDNEKIDVVFVTVPRAEDGEKELQRLNAVNKIIESRGYPVLALTDKYKEMGLDLSCDFHNPKHTNIHGSFKVTRYLSEYLVEKYSLEDLRQSEDAAEWDAVWNEYMAEISPYVVEPETDVRHADYSLEYPKELTAVRSTDNNVEISWNTVENADGYILYKKNGAAAPWEMIAELGNEIEYTDTECTQGKAHYYTVMPIRMDTDGIHYGKYYYWGVKVQ